MPDIAPGDASGGGTAPTPPAGDAADSGDPMQKLDDLGNELTDFVDMMAQDKSVPPEAQKAFAAALQALQQGAMALQGPQTPPKSAPGVVTTQQGGGKTLPMPPGA